MYIKYFKLAITILLSSSEVIGQESLDAALRDVSYEIRFDEGEFEGPGAEWLLNRGARSQFVVLGETHGIAEGPKFAEVLLKGLIPYGYKFVALEIGPHTAQALDEYARTGEEKSLRNYLAHLPQHVPPQSQEELRFARFVGERVQDPRQLLWGLDQENRAILLLRKMRQQILVKGLQELILEAILVAEANERTGEKLFMGLGEKLDAITVAMTPDQPMSAREILNSLVVSNRIYANYDKNNYQSNFEREQSMKNLFLRNYRRAQSSEKAPRVLLRLGGNHVIRGMNFANVLSLGTFVSEFAIIEGSESLNINVICGRNGKTAGIGDALGKVVACDAPEIVSWFKPFGVAARWDVTLFDHQALRHRVRKLKLTPEFIRYLHGFDASILIANTDPVRFDYPDPQEILRKAAHACSGVRSASFRGKWEGHGVLENAFPTVEGRMFLERFSSDDPIGGRFSFEGKLNQPSAEKSLRIAYDGELVRSLQHDALLYAEPESGGLHLLRHVQRLVFEPFLSSDPLKNELDASSLEMEALDQIDGEYCYVLRVKYPDGFDPFVKEARWFIGTEDYQPRKVEYLFQDNTEHGAAVLSLSELMINREVDPDVFSLQPPIGHSSIKFVPHKPAPLLPEGAIAPNWTLVDLDGSQRSLSEMQGKVVVIDFWATWCLPCRKLQPVMKSLQEELGTKGIVVGINVLETGDPIEYIEKHNLDYLQLLHGDDVAKSYGVTGLPVVYVIGVDGKILFRQSGIEPGFQNLREVIRTHLSRSSQIP